MRQTPQPQTGPALRKFREVRGFSGRDFSLRTGISQGHISELENGRKNLTPALVERIAAGCGMAAEAVVAEIDEISRGNEVLADAATVHQASPEHDATGDLLRWLVARMTAEERAGLIRECTEKAIGGDAAAGARARMLLLLLEEINHSTPPPKR